MPHWPACRFAAREREALGQPESVLWTPEGSGAGVLPGTPLGVASGVGGGRRALAVWPLH